MNKLNVLMVANTASMIKLFNMSNIHILQELGCRVIVATNFLAPGTISSSDSQRLQKELKDQQVKYYQVDFCRKLGNPRDNLKAYRQLSSIVENEQISLIHTHAPLSSIISRQVAHSYHINSIYTSHGFQFFPGGPIKNWLLYYPVERHFARYSDVIITINSDDYKTIQRFPTRYKYYLPGIGTSVKDLFNMDIDQRQCIRTQFRQSLGVKNSDFVLLSVGELTKRKNHATVLKAIAKLKDPHIKYFVAGIGPEHDHLLNLARQLGINDQFSLLGYQHDVTGLYLAADLNCFISTREGLGMGGLEGCILGLYILANGNTGAKDYIPDSQIGQLIDEPTNVDEVANKISAIKHAHLKAAPNNPFFLKFDQTNIDSQMRKIYQEELQRIWMERK